MGYAGGTSAERRKILDQVRKKLNAQKDKELAGKLDLEDWNSAFDRLNEHFWNGKLTKIPVSVIRSHKKYYGMYFNSGMIHLNAQKNLSPVAMLGVLLHEMCHHWVHTKYGHGTTKGGKRIIGHGKEWKREMRRVGYTGKITKYTGYGRFVGSELPWN